MLALDGSVSPYLPTREILAALATRFRLDLDSVHLARMLRERLAHLHGIAPERIALFPNDECRFIPLVAMRADRPLALFPPTELDRSSLARTVPIINIERSRRFGIDASQIQAMPRGSTALVMTPNDPTGSAIGLVTAAQLAKRSGLLILDERSAEMQRRSMIPLVEEFDSIVLMRSFADWAGLGVDAPGYAITTRRIAAQLDRPGELSVFGLNGALAAVSDASTLDAVAHRVRVERLRLYRMLRKLNFLMPYPSDAGYVLAEVTRGERDQILTALAERDIAVFAPTAPRLERTLRFSAISPAATAQLQAALIDISQTVLV